MIKKMEKMKKTIGITLSIVVLCTFAACDRTISPDKLPRQAQQFVTANFNDANILSVRRDGFKYDVILSNGTELEFKHDGSWKEIDCGLNPLPAGVLPTPTAQYLSANFPMNSATHVKYENRRYEVELDNDLDLVFDKNGLFFGADD